ncbi:Protein of unknown function [Gryllus bimaculatus]|nr:Protein of unknown function [Gryllus bimaculatus]
MNKGKSPGSHESAMKRQPRDAKKFRYSHWNREVLKGFPNDMEVSDLLPRKPSCYIQKNALKNNVSNKGISNIFIINNNNTPKMFINAFNILVAIKQTRNNSQHTAISWMGSRVCAGTDPLEEEFLTFNPIPKDIW